MAGSFKTEFAPDGSGDWKIHLPVDADQHDVLALGPVIEGMRAFLAPTVNVVDLSSKTPSLRDASDPTVADPDAPIELRPTAGDIPDLTA